MQTLAFDLGGTFLRCGAANGESLHSIERERLSNLATDTSGSLWTAVLARMAAYVERLAGNDRDETEIVVSFPGPIRGHGVALCAPTVPDDPAFAGRFATDLEQRTGLPVLLLNDVSAATWYLQRFVDADRFAVVTVSSGIGSKIFDRANRNGVLDGMPYSGEIGHIVVDDDPAAPLCDCGGRGHLGAIASGRGTERLARQMAARAAESFAQSAPASVYGATPLGLTNEAHLVPAARAGDRWTWDVICTAMRPLAQTLAIVTHAVGLQKIVVIGGFAESLGERYAAELGSAVAGFSSGPMFEVPIRDLVILWKSADDACLRGAVEFARAMSPRLR